MERAYSQLLYAESYGQKISVAEATTNLESLLAEVVTSREPGPIRRGEGDMALIAAEIYEA